MESMDAADHPLASEAPEADPLDELIAELKSSDELGDDDIERIVREWADGRDSVQSRHSSGALVEVLCLFTEPNRDPRILAYAMLYVLNKCPISMADAAQLIGCTRAAISKEKRILERRFGLQSRVSITAEAVEDRAIACRARGKRKPRGVAWVGATILNQSLRKTI
jgi:hypothetical protein